jgi:small GTP-binding protein
LSDEAQEYLVKVNARLQEEADKPLFVAVMGQTGVGKSSLINALFDTQLPTDPVRPCTMEPTEVTVTSTAAGHPLTFVDLPGVGESATADPQYLRMYRRYLEVADVTIWAMHADSRSLAADVAWIHELTGNGGAAVDKITIVLTKADLIHVDPWIVPVSGELPAQVRVQPGPRTAALLDRKCQYAQEIVAAGLPGRIGENRPIACSSVLRFNLAAVMSAVIDRLDDLAIRRLTPHLDIDGLDRSDADEVFASADLMALDLARRVALRFGDLVGSALVGSASTGGVR